MNFLPLDIHFNYTPLADIPSLSEVDSHYQVTMDTTVESSSNVHINDHTIIKFLKCGSGLYYFDTAKSNKYQVNYYSFISNVKDNKSYFSRREIEGSDISDDLKGVNGWYYVQYY